MLSFGTLNLIEIRTLAAKRTNGQTNTETKKQRQRNKPKIIPAQTLNNMQKKWTVLSSLCNFALLQRHRPTHRNLTGEHYLNLLKRCGFANLESLVHENRFESKIHLPPENPENLGVPFTGTFHGMSQDRIAPGGRVPKGSQENCLGRTFQRKTVNSQNGTAPENNIGITVGEHCETLAETSWEQFWV